MTSVITVKARVDLPVSKVWKYWTEPGYITKWNAASDDWHTPKAENDLKVGGLFVYRMEAKDGSFGFDFGGTYNRVEPNKLIAYTIGDGRDVQVSFIESENATLIVESFEAESQNPIEMQQAGWQAILDNFKKYAEEQSLKQVHFEIIIDAPSEVVFRKMLEKPTYEEWTKPFNPTSSYKGTWVKGSKMIFFGTDDEGNIGGMVSRVKELVPDKFVSIEHLGVIQDQTEITEGPEVEAWAGAFENYTFIQEGEKTRLEIDMESSPVFLDYLTSTWPAALNKLKEICER